MTYKLAKRLKDAGFPQSPYFRFCRHTEENDGVIMMSCDCKFEDKIHDVSLSELIEACPKQIGENIFDLCWLYDKWDASYLDLLADEAPNMKILPKSEQIEAFGSTPEEAIANLWLELNKK